MTREEMIIQKNIDKAQKILDHGNNLNKIFNTGLDPVVLYKKLRRLENKAHRLAEDTCNWLSMDSPEFAVRETRIMKSLGKILFRGNRMLSIPIFINFDARGYALKINADWIREKNIEIERDWGGYGIIAPDF